jgi:pyruvate/2-oxoglutarate/acetoin dehydrogenase E1 component/TPP-dependent pyruvate/acetoin dehydrogenase alpha subunit
MTANLIETVPKLALKQDQLLQDYRLAFRSRQASLVGRREVMSGKAKFGIFGDGKELPQLAMAHVFRPGDWRSGYYRDQTFMLATGELTLEAYFAQLYAHADVQADPATAGRAMNAHFATRSLDDEGRWVDLARQFNVSPDVSPTGAQMPRLVGLAYASRLYRELKELRRYTRFSRNGDEVAFGTIGNASTAEGMFWEAVNAIGVLRAPAVITIYDDGYGISVTNEHQMVKGNLTELLQGFRRAPGGKDGYDLYTVKGWDYPALLEAYAAAAETARREHIPAILHVVELTQPQGHSTSGSHERYKTKERLDWEAAFDGVHRLRQRLLDQGAVQSGELERLEEAERREVEAARKRAWEAYLDPILGEREEAARLMEALAGASQEAGEIGVSRQRLLNVPTPLRRDILAAVHAALASARFDNTPARQALVEWKRRQEAANLERYGSHLYSRSAESALKVPVVTPVFSDSSPSVHGFEVINACFDAALARDPRLIAFGEDVGRLGDVNQGFRGLQEKYGELRVSDTGIRELTIAGQAIGMALRGLRPLAEIQYLDYLLYALQILSDDLANLHWRTHGGQKAPAIFRTRGHRLEGIWHSGSPMAGILHLVRGMHVLVPRNMTQAAGFYNTLFRCDDPALVVEVLNGYRIKERLPDNIGELTLPLGVPEVIRPGEDVTLVTYGACCRIALDAAGQLAKVGVETEVIDVQSLLPFDLPGVILESLKKTSRIVLVDEDVPGGTTAYMLQEVLEKQGGYFWLDSPPRTLPGKPHRPAYGSDGDYFSKPNAQEIFEAVYDLMHEADPQSYPLFYR